MKSNVSHPQSEAHFMQPVSATKNKNILLFHSAEIQSLISLNVTHI